ncbi:MAG: hypothetical protein ACOVNL_09725 [Prochlorococcaceae cyanobacterium]|jgi:hypothetical protein
MKTQPVHIPAAPSLAAHPVQSGLIGSRPRLPWALSLDDMVSAQARRAQAPDAANPTPLAEVQQPGRE